MTRHANEPERYDTRRSRGALTAYAIAAAFVTLTGALLFTPSTEKEALTESTCSVSEEPHAMTSAEEGEWWWSVQTSECGRLRLHSGLTESRSILTTGSSYNMTVDSADY